MYRKLPRGQNAPDTLQPYCHSAHSAFLTTICLSSPIVSSSMRKEQTLLALWASLICPCSGITIRPNAMGGLAMAQILFNNSKDIYSASSGYSGDPAAIRAFTDGPFGMEKGIILSTGSLTSPIGPGDTCPSSYTTDVYDAYTQTYCGADSYNGANFLLNVVLTKATTFLVDIVIASCDLVSADKVLLLIDGVNYAKDENGVALDSSSKYLSEPWGIPSPNGDTAFLMSSPPLRFSIPIRTPSVALRIAVCDRLDGYGDTAVMVKIRPCNDCDQPFKVDYDTTSVTSTTTYEATSVNTQPASGTARGTISYITYVAASATSTTSSSPDSTLEDITSSTASASSAFSTSYPTASATQSSAPLSCNEMSNPYQGISGLKFQVDCNSYATGGNQIGSTHKTFDLSACIELCATTKDCQAALLDRSQSLCYFLDGTDGPAFNDLYDMATLLSYTSSTTAPSEKLSTTTTSSSSAETSLSCTQMAGSIYAEKFTISCDTISTGESIYRRAEEDSMENCLAMCDKDNRCLAINFYPYPRIECHLVESFTGTRPSASINFASKAILSFSTTSTSSGFIQSTLSTDASVSSSAPWSDSTPESTPEDSTKSTGVSSSIEATSAISITTTTSIDTASSIGMSTIETLTIKTLTTEAPVVGTSTVTTSATAINQSSMSEGASCRRRRRSQR
ncbi:unnamed protein product [Fusarium equiseti]|uniref:Apple domain-containing protein n=1 Tax=Fusarium equiseti TaxID=61235 RepID=A0A8J2III0_FUSEQ|nr:unnamed protein product [Fusarium equiseti]